jgi:hypothetical protein
MNIWAEGQVPEGAEAPAFDPNKPYIAYDITSEWHKDFEKSSFPLLRICPRGKLAMVHSSVAFIECIALCHPLVESNRTESSPTSDENASERTELQNLPVERKHTLSIKRQPLWAFELPRSAEGYIVEGRIFWKGTGTYSSFEVTISDKSKTIQSFKANVVVPEIKVSFSPF